MEREYGEAADEPHTFWYCNACNAQNSMYDGECQYCECEGTDCKRDSCSDPKHFQSVTSFEIFGEEFLQ